MSFFTSRAKKRQDELEFSPEQIKNIKRIIYEDIINTTISKIDRDRALFVLTYLSTRNLVKQSSTLSCLTWALILFAIMQIVVVILVGTGVIS